MNSKLIIYQMSKSLSIVIPTYNSEKHLKLAINKLIDFLPSINTSYEIVIINDGSTDKTYNICKEFKLNYPSIIKAYNLKSNQGQKIATLVGIHKSSGRYVITFDDDLQHNVEDIKTLYSKIAESENYLIVSTKYNYHSPQKNYNKFRIISLGIVSLFFKQYLNLNYFSSFKAYDLKKLRELNLENVYLFWNIPINRISCISLSKKDGIRAGTSYNIINRMRIFSGILNKMLNIILAITIIPFAVFLYFFLPNYMPLLIVFFLIYAVTNINYLIEKNRYKKVHADLI